MRKLNVLILAIIIIFTSISCAKKKEPVLQGTVVEDDLNVRSSPRGKVVARLSVGDKVLVLGRTKKKYKVGQWENYWYKIKMKDGKTGWCFSQWIAIGDNVSPAATMRGIKHSIEGYDFYLYSAHFKDNSIGVYSIAPDGLLKFLGITRAVKSPSHLAAHPEKPFLYLVDKTRIISYRLKENGRPEAIGTMNRGAGSLYVNVHPSGRFVYLTSANPLINISMYAVQRDGRLKAMGDIFTYKAPRKFVIHPNGTLAYFYDSHKINAIMAYRIKTAGKLELIEETVIGGKAEGAIAVHPNGKYLYAADIRGGALNIYSIDIAGKLKLSAALPGIAFPGDIIFNENGTFAYISFPRTGKIVAYKVSEDGKLVVSGETEAGQMPRDIEMHPNGKFLYAAAAGSNNVFIFAIKPDGNLEKKAVIPAGNNPLSISIGRVKQRESNR